MSLSSKGCRAKIDGVLKTTEKTITVELTTYTAIIVNGQKKFRPDFTGRVCLINHNNEMIKGGDMIDIESFYIKNRDGRIRHQFDSIVITDWKVVLRNQYNKKFYKKKTASEILKEKQRQRQAIEEEIEAEEQDIDEYIDNNGEDDIPF